MKKLSLLLSIFILFLSNKTFSNNCIEVTYIPRSESNKEARINICVTGDTKIDWGDGHLTIVTPKQLPNNQYLSQEINHKYSEYGHFRQRIESHRLTKLSLAEIIWTDNIGVQDSLVIGDCPVLEEFITFQLQDIDSLDFSSCPNLKTLVLRYSLIKNVNLKNNLNLEYLDLSQTNLLSLDISKCPLIKVLLLNSTKIKDLDLRDNPDIEKLYTYDCNIMMLNLKNAPRIQRIWCDKNTEVLLPHCQYSKHKLGKSVDYRTEVPQ